MGVLRGHVLLAVGAVLVAGLALYLFVQVRATPTAVASVTKSADVRRDPDPAEPAADTDAKWTAKNDKPAAKRSPLERPSPFKAVNDAKSDPEVPPPSIDDGRKADPKADAILDEVNRAYDHGEYDEAKTQALKQLGGELEPAEKTRMLRVVVSSSCILGDGADAQKYYAQLPQRDKNQMKVRCERYGVSFTDAP